MCMRSIHVAHVRAAQREIDSCPARNGPTAGEQRRLEIRTDTTTGNQEMLHVRLCTIQRENAEEAFGFELWRSRRKSASSPTPEQYDNADLLIVKSVYPGSPAEKGDLRENDKIIAVDGTNVRDAKTVRELLATALEVRVMVERWEGPKIQVVDRKASTPTAPQRSVRVRERVRFTAVT